MSRIRKYVAGIRQNYHGEQVGYTDAWQKSEEITTRIRRTVRSRGENLENQAKITTGSGLIARIRGNIYWKLPRGSDMKKSYVVKRIQYPEEIPRESGGSEDAW